MSAILFITQWGSEGHGLPSLSWVLLSLLLCAGQSSTWWNITEELHRFLSFEGKMSKNIFIFKNVFVWEMMFCCCQNPQASSPGGTPPSMWLSECWCPLRTGNPHGILLKINVCIYRLCFYLLSKLLISSNFASWKYAEKLTHSLGAFGCVGNLVNGSVGSIIFQHISKDVGRAGMAICLFNSYLRKLIPALIRRYSSLHLQQDAKCLWIALLSCFIGVNSTIRAVTGHIYSPSLLPLQASVCGYQECHWSWT